MDLTKEQRVMLQKIWTVLKNKFVEFIGKTRSRNVTIVDSLNKKSSICCGYCNYYNLIT